MNAPARLGTFHFAAGVAALLLLCGCGEDTPPIGGVEPPPVTFLFALHDADSGPQLFSATTNDEAVIAQARAQLQLPIAQRSLHINGAIRAAQPPQNRDWHWRFVDDEWTLVQVSIEACDGTPALVEQNLSYWLQYGRFCPWGAYVAAEGETQMASGLIIQFTGSPGGVLLQQRIAMVESAAAGQGIALTYVREGALGAHVWSFDGLRPVTQAAQLAQAITLVVPGIEYAEPDALVQPHLP